MQHKDKHREEETMENINDLTDKIILAVLDHLDSAGPVRTDCTTKGLLISTVEKLQKIVVTTGVGKSGEKKKAQLLPDEVRRSAARTVSQILLSSTEAWEMTSSPVGEIGLDSMLEAMARSGYPTDLLRSLLDSTSRNILQTIECNENVSSYRNFILDRMTKRINEKVKTFLTVSAELVRKGGTEIEQDTEPSSSHLSHLDDLTIKCTHEVLDGIIQICHQHGRGGPTELSEQGVEEVMQELESIISSRGSSSRHDLKVIDLEESEETSQLHQDHESLLSDGFHQKVKRSISDALLKTAGEVSSQSKSTLGDITVVDLEMCAEQLSTPLKSLALVESAASDIAEAIVEDLKKVSSQQEHNGSVTEPEPSRENFHSAACRLYRNVHFKVFGFLSKLQESHSSSVSESAAPISPPPRCIPRLQVREGSCMNEDCIKVVELYKSELLLPSSAYRRGFSSAAQTTSAADVHTAAVTTPVSEAAERTLESRTSWATLNSSCETLSRLGDVSSTPAGPHTSNPFSVFRRVKDFLTNLFTGAGRPGARHTPTSTRDGEAHLTEELIEDLLSCLDSDHTITDRTRDYLTRDCESPDLDYKTYSSRSSQVEDNVPTDPDPATVKERGLRFRKRLTRTFSAIRRALPNPFQCVTAPP